MSTTVHFDTDNVRDKRIQPFSGSGRSNVGEAVNKKDVQDFFPNALGTVTDYISVECFKEKLKTLIENVLKDIGDNIRFEYAQLDKAEAVKKRSIAQTEEMMAMQKDRPYMHRSLRSEGMSFDSRSLSQSLKEQKKSLSRTIYNKNLKPTILMRIDREYWHSLKALEKNEREMDRIMKGLYSDMNTYLNKAFFSGVGVAASALSFSYRKFNLTTAGEKKELFSVAEKTQGKLHLYAQRSSFTQEIANTYITKTDKPIAYNGSVGVSSDIVNNLMKKMLGKEQYFDVSLDFDLFGLNNVLWGNIIQENSESTSEPIDCMSQFGVFGTIAQFEKHIGLAAAGVNLVFNTAAAIHTYSAIRSNKRLYYEIRRSHFSNNYKISKAVFQDFEKLNEKDIDTLIEKVLKIQIKDYIPDYEAHN